MSVAKNGVTIRTIEDWETRPTQEQDSLEGRP